ncbi:hypothetical protein DSM25559_0382 [Agrobacterium rosae]|uniref:Uncharacterized protein n=1 Tax=Agrobacterium rosae TaxID=1972867 RepID=A0A1R3TGU6_9HYPH|nr:hypothetical protein DSM25559_0382 [Agrobacterium rosae]
MSTKTNIFLFKDVILLSLTTDVFNWFLAPYEAHLYL